MQGKLHQSEEIQSGNWARFTPINRIVINVKIGPGQASGDTNYFNTQGQNLLYVS
jgi:hypothetical protein